MMRKQTGIVLVPVLLILVLITSLLLYQFDALRLATQIARNTQHQWESEQTANQFLDSLSQRVDISLPNCQLNSMSAHEITQQDNNWWAESNKCHEKKSSIQLDYFLVFLQKDPCQILNGKGVEFWQATVRAHQQQKASVILQVILAVPQKNIEACLANPSNISSSLRAWRWIS